MYEWLDERILKYESKLGKPGWALIVAFAFMVAAAIYVRPAIRTVALGFSYSQLSLNPFDFSKSIAASPRILAPLISYLLGLRGELIIVTNLLMAFLLLTVMYLYFRPRLPRPGDTLIAVAVFAFSLVTLTTVYYGGYTDSLTYLIVFLMWWFRRKRTLFYVLFFLGMLNRESILFLVPWFIFISYPLREKKVWWLIDVVAGFALTIGLYFLYTHWLASVRAVGLTPEYYLSPLLEDPLHFLRRSWMNQRLGFFTVFKATWIFVLAVLISLWRDRQFRMVGSILLLLACVWAQTIVAWDSSRMLTLGFPVMILAMLHLFKTDAFRVRTWAPLVVLFNFFIPQLYTAAEYIEHMRSLLGNLIAMKLFGQQTW